MGEEKKEAGKKEEEEKKKEEEVKKEEKKEEEEKKDELINEDIIVLKVDMHCEACARKVARSLKGFQGVEEVMADCKASRVVVKGKAADPVKVCQRIQKKSGRKVVIISPLPKPLLPPENKPEENKAEDPPKEEKKDEPPPVITVVLKVRMHCEACAQVLEKRIRKVKGVESVTADIGNDKVTVKGVLDPEKLVNDVYKRTGKQASIVKEEEKKEEQEVKKDEEKKDEEKKDEKQDEKKESKEDEEEEEESKKMEIKKMEYWPPKYYMDHAYAPQLFSDENPNACSVM